MKNQTEELLNTLISMGAKGASIFNHEGCTVLEFIYEEKVYKIRSRGAGFAKAFSGSPKAASTLEIEIK